MENKELTITVDLNELNIIFASLQEGPHRVVNALLIKLEQQAKSQLDAEEQLKQNK